MDYNELLQKMSLNIDQASSLIAEENANTNTMSFNSKEQTSALLNQIGLEVQRQGGY